MSDERDPETDQPLPVVNEHGFVQDQVIADIEKRKALGIRKYGTALQPHNGRDALQDAYEEALDLAIYLRQALMERQVPMTAEQSLRYISSPTMGLPSGRDAEEYALEADERLVRLALQVRSCIAGGWWAGSTRSWSGTGRRGG